MKSIIALDYRHGNYDSYIAFANVNNQSTSITYFSTYLSSIGIGNIGIMTAENSIFELNTWISYSTEYVVNNLLDILNDGDTNSYEFYYDSDIINIELL